jgi:urease accessory protein
VAVQKQIIKVTSKAMLEWFPSENILFSGSRAQIQTKVELAHDSHFVGWEISCLGRPASEEFFSQGELDQRFEVWRDGKPLRIERLKLKGGDPALDAKWGLLGFPVIGSMVLVTEKTKLIDSLRAITNIAVEEGFFSATQMDGAVLCYFLGNSVERARKCFISAWKVLRREVIGFEAVEPRIWKT